MCGYFCNGFIDHMFAGEILIDYTILLLQHDVKKNDEIILNYFKIGEASSMYQNLSGQTQFKLKENQRNKRLFYRGN